MDTVHDAHFQAETVRIVDPHAAEWERNYAGWIHRGALIGSIAAALSANIGQFLVAGLVLVLWLVKREESPYIDDHGREALNFQISIFLYTLLVVPIAILTCGLGALLIIPIAILALVGTWNGAKAGDAGEYYRYPACIRLLH